MLRKEREFVLGPSSMRWEADTLVIDINEISVPFPFPVRGTVRLHPHGLSNRLWALDHGAKHHWGPIAPSASVEVKMATPSIAWKGHAYFDANEGTEPLNKGDDPTFIDWDWSRASLRNGSTAVIYDVRQTPALGAQSNETLLTLLFSRDASAVTNFEPPPRQEASPGPVWRMRRKLRSEASSKPVVTQTLEDTPFYIRSVLQSHLLGESVMSLHETLNVPRLTALSTQMMLPFRMPRRG